MTLSAGYETRALEASRDFRVLMDAMSRPGTLQPVPQGTETIAGLNAGAVVAALTLCDHETLVYVDDGQDNENVREFLAFRCGCTITDNVSEADFAFFSSFPSLEVLEKLKVGNSQYPDRSATAVVQVDAVAEDGPFELSGPGIRDRHLLDAPAIEPEFVEWWSGNGERFPLGIDMILTTGEVVVGLPRTVKIRECQACM